MSGFDSWSAYWCEQLRQMLRSEDPQAFVGQTEYRAAAPHSTEGMHPPGTSVVFEEAVLVLVDHEQNAVHLAALPQWFGPLEAPHDQTSASELHSRAQADALANGVVLRHLSGPDGSSRTAYTRSLRLQPAEFASVVSDEHMSAGARVYVDDFVRSAANASNAYFDRAVIASPTPAGYGFAGAAAHRGSGGKATLISVLSAAAVLVLGIGAAAIAGFANGYDHEVLVQEAVEETYKDEPTGYYDVIETGEQICGGDQDYLSCVNSHVAVFNSACAQAQLTYSGELTCDSLSEFITKAQAAYADCGAGCLTAADSSGEWGWPYLEQVAEMQTVIDQEAQPEITRTERCDFDLGPIQFGSCPR